MTDRLYSGLFVAEGSSDIPLANIVQDLFLERGVLVRLSQPDYSLMAEKVKKDINIPSRRGDAADASAPRSDRRTPRLR
jgi:hypothetical protein